MVVQPKNINSDFFACYSFDDQKSYMLYDPQEIRDIIERHKYIISFNGVGFKYKTKFFWI